MRIVPALTFALAAVVAYPASADILTVKQSAASSGATVVSGSPLRCSDGPLILQVGKPDNRKPCTVATSQPVVRNTSSLTIVVLAHESRGHYRHRGHHGPRD